jgi:DNA-binding MarR family transcriptional regulator
MIAELKALFQFSHMTVRQLAVLLALHREGRSIRLVEVGRILGIEPPVLSRAYDSLEEYGLIERRRGDDDRRQMYAVVTEEGRKLAKRFK